MSVDAPPGAFYTDRSRMDTEGVCIMDGGTIRVLKEHWPFALVMALAYAYTLLANLF